MKKILPLLFIVILFPAFSQPGCQFYHSSMDDFPPLQFRSGDESLRSDTVDVLHYSVYLDFTEGDMGLLKGNCQIKFKALQDIQTISLDLLQLTIDSIVHQGITTTFSYNDTLIVASLGGTLNAGQEDSIRVYYRGLPQTDPSGWGGFYMSNQYFYNLGVGFESNPHNYGRTWHPCFDNFVERATYDFEVLTANNFTAYCNGSRTGVQTVGTDSLLTNWMMSTEIPSYLAAVAVAEYTHVTDNYFSVSQGINIPIWLAAKAGDTTNLKNSFLNLNNAMEAFEDSYGPYVWERIGYVLVPFNAGAMEHATNIAYPLVTVNGALTYETLMAHELSHHWWGNLVTCATAEEMWINEGLASYSEHLFLENVYDQNTYMNAMRDNHYDVLHRAHINDSGYYALNAVPVEYTYGDHSYNKGADVMHTLRGYLGDANFFAALQAVQTAYSGSHITSEQFRDEINTLAGIDVTDFFNDWIFQAGFSHFSITNVTSVQNGSTFNVDVIVDQKLKGASNYHDNVPLQLTFLDENWNSHTEQILMGGDYAQFGFNLPFNPVFAAINMDEKINDATTAENITITSTGIILLNYANARLNVQQLSDSAFLRIEHNWVYADNPGAPENTVVSFDRYWNIHGVNADLIEGEIRFEFNGRNNATGDLDNSLMQHTGNQTFTEDSLVLLYRPDAQSHWETHPDFSLNTVGSVTDKFGFLTANTFMPGQYCFGYKTNSVGVQEKPTSGTVYSIYPNPTDTGIFIDLSQWDETNVVVDFYAISGQKVASKPIKSGQVNQLSVSDMSPGSYLLILTDGKSKRYGSKRIVVK
ncbi:MAG: M1 family aminopeptidase [Crocinitomicaceae bacterium]